MSLFKAGDEVGSMLGDDVLVDSGNDFYPLMLKKYEITITTEGKSYKAHAYPSVWHRKTGSAPIVGEAPFDYPIYMKSLKSGAVYKFTGLKEGEIVVKGTGIAMTGYKCKDLYPHTDDSCWQECAAPQEAKELTVAQIEKALGYKVKIVK